MKTKHTPGPWESYETGSKRNGLPLFTLYTSGPLAYVTVEDSETGRANVGVMAAAPELLEAVKVCRVEAESLRRQYVSEDAGEEWIERQSYLVGLCDAAIAKATGETA